MTGRRCQGMAGACPNPGKLYPRGAWCDECRPWGPPPVPDPSRTLAALPRAEARRARLDWSQSHGPCSMFLYVGGPLT